MTRFVAFILLFVIGTQSTNSFDDSSSSEEIADVATTLREKVVTSVINATIEADEAKCERKNLSAVAQAVRNSYDELVTCYDVNVDLSALMTTVMISMFRNDDTLIPKFICGRAEALLSCARNYSNLAKPCSDDDDRLKADLGYNFTNSGLKYFCGNGQARLNNFIRAQGFECVQQRSEGLNACTQNYTQDSSEESSVSASSEDYNSTLTTLCTGLRELRNCTVNEFRQCENQTPANVVDGFFEELKKAWACANVSTIQLP